MSSICLPLARPAQQLLPAILRPWGAPYRKAETQGPSLPSVLLLTTGWDLCEHSHHSALVLG